MKTSEPPPPHTHTHTHTHTNCLTKQSRIAPKPKTPHSFVSPIIKFISVPKPIGSLGGHKGRFSRDPLPVFSAGGPCEQFQHGCPLFDVIHQASPLPTTVSLNLQGALKDGLGVAAMVCDMPKSCKFLSLDSSRKRFLWTQKEVDLALHPVVGLVLHLGDVEKFPHTLGFRTSIFLSVTMKCGQGY